MEGPVYRKSIEFAISLISLYKEMLRNQEYIISKQLIRAGTSIGANVQEATSAQSRRDFINKMSIAAKEAKETRYWLIVLSEGKLINFDYSKLLGDIDEIIKILSKIIITAKNNLNTKLKN
jgi:four helix bundle protein